MRAVSRQPEEATHSSCLNTLLAGTVSQQSRPLPLAQMEALLIQKKEQFTGIACLLHSNEFFFPPGRKTHIKLLETEVWIKSSPNVVTQYHLIHKIT